MRDSARLNGCRCEQALFRECARKRLGQTEVGEGVKWHEVDAPAPVMHAVMRKNGCPGVRLPARQWGERVVKIFPGGLAVLSQTKCQSRNHGRCRLYRRG